MYHTSLFPFFSAASDGKCLLFCCSTRWTNFTFSLFDSVLSRIASEIAFCFCYTYFSHSLLLAYLVITLEVIHAHFGIDKRQVHVCKCYCTILKQNLRARMTCLICYCCKTKAEVKHFLSLCWRVDQHLFFVSKKQLASAPFNILVVLNAPEHPSLAVFFLLCCMGHAKWIVVTVTTLKEKLWFHNTKIFCHMWLQHASEAFLLHWGIPLVALSSAVVDNSSKHEAFCCTCNWSYT